MSQKTIRHEVYLMMQATVAGGAISDSSTSEAMAAEYAKSTVDCILRNNDTIVKEPIDVLLDGIPVKSRLQ